MNDNQQFGFAALIGSVVAIAAAAMYSPVFLVSMAMSAPLFVIMSKPGGFGQMVTFVLYLLVGSAVFGLYVLFKFLSSFEAFTEGRINPQSELEVSFGVLLLSAVFCLACYFAALDRFFEGDMSEYVRDWRDKIKAE